MSVLVFAESSEGKFKKAAFEATSYAKKIAEKLGTNLVVLAINANNPNELFTYGAEKVLNITNENLPSFNAKLVSHFVKVAAEKEDSTIIIISSTSNGLYLSPFIAVNMDAGYASNVTELPSNLDPFIVKRKSFSSNAYVNTEITTSKKVIGLSKNSFGIIENPCEGTIENFIPPLVENTLIFESIERTTGKVSIADADIVVSGGRGLKGPENWGIIEELADVLGAATACSKPVSDLEWRPHSEHVGQTGKQVACNLYIAIGISGAIQHLAGVNSSKVKVVINTDAEAPFFKAADYGIVGDAFEVVPELIEKLREFKANTA